LAIHGPQLIQFCMFFFYFYIKTCAKCSPCGNLIKIRAKRQLQSALCVPFIHSTSHTHIQSHFRWMRALRALNFHYSLNKKKTNERKKKVNKIQAKWEILVKETWRQGQIRWMVGATPKLKGFSKWGKAAII